MIEETVDLVESITAKNDADDDFGKLTNRPTLATQLIAHPQLGVLVGRFVGFDLQDQPLIAELTCFPGQVVPARTVISLQRRMIDAQVVVTFEEGELGYPIILGVIQNQKSTEPETLSFEKMPVYAQIDNERVEIAAEREIVLRCGDASITLTRAGKVIIKGNYIISRSAGYNKIKGAAIELN